MSVRWLVTHKQMTVLYTTDRYLAGHAAESEIVCVLEQGGGVEGQCVVYECVCVCTCMHVGKRAMKIFKTKSGVMQSLDEGGTTQEEEERC